MSNIGISGLDNSKFAISLAKSLRVEQSHFVVDLDDNNCIGSTSTLDGLVLADTIFTFEKSSPANISLSFNTHSKVLIERRLHKFETGLSMLKSGGSVVAVLSGEITRGSFSAISYCACMSANVELIRGFCNLLGVSSGIRVNAVAPGWIEGIFDNEQVIPTAIKNTPLRRLGTVDEVINVIRFLLSEQSSFVSGQVLFVDGGYSVHDPVASHEYRINQSVD